MASYPILRIIPASICRIGIHGKVSKDFYVGKTNGGCREIVPFELTWLLDVVGMPKEVFGYRG